MNLDLGGIQQIDQPSSSDCEHYLRFMPIESPFVILKNDADEFIQATYTGDEYRAEYSLDNGYNQFYCLTDYNTAVHLFLNFLDGKTEYRDSIEWKRIRSPGFLDRIKGFFTHPNQT